MWFKSNFAIPVIIAICLCLIGGTVPVAADIINVPGDYPTVQAGIDAAMHGDEVVVAPGTYSETINLFGKAITVRSSDGAEVTTIDAGGTGTVVTCLSGEGPDTILDGFTITGGSAAFGGGMYNDQSSPTVTDCTFTQNAATGDSGGGGGMFNLQSNPTLTGCSFTQNTAPDGTGGGMYNLQSNPTLISCSFTQNTADDHNVVGFGGGVHNSLSDPTLTECTFLLNSAGVGGGMANTDSSSPTVTNCMFSGNFASSGGGMYNSGSTPMVTNCTFNANNGSFGGGGMLNRFSAPTVIDCTFTNHVAFVGGGMLNIESDSIVTNCEFHRNKVQVYLNEGGLGGGMANSDSSPIISACTFSENSTDGFGGGGISNFRGQPRITNCTFSENSAVGSGGGIYNDISDPPITNCTFSENSARWGGGVANFHHNPNIDDCTFSNNSADRGGGIYNYDSNLVMNNCTFSDNSAADYGGAMYNRNQSGPRVTSSIFHGNSAGASGGAMYNAIQSIPLVSDSIFAVNDPDHIDGEWTDAGGNEFFDRAILTSCSITFGSTDNDPCDVANLVDDDDIDQILRSQFGFSAFERNLTEIVINGLAPGALNMVSIDTREGSDTTNVVAKVKARNYKTNSIVDLEEYDVSFASDDTAHSTPVNSTDFIKFSGDVEVRLRYVAPATFTPLGFTVGLDQVQVMVE